MTLEVILAFGIPSTITAFCFWLLKRHLDKAEKRREAREHARIKNETLMFQAVGATFALGEATAKSIQTGKPNGELSAALSYAQKIKHEHKDFVIELGIQNLYTTKGA